MRYAAVMASANDFDEEELEKLRQERIAFLTKELGKISSDGRENIEKAIELYRQKKLPGPKGRVHITYFEEGKIVKNGVDGLDFTKPLWHEV